jgi:hypothetical protein
VLGDADADSARGSPLESTWMRWLWVFCVGGWNVIVMDGKIGVVDCVE